MRPRATVLIVVMVMMAMAAMVAVGLLYSMGAQGNASTASARGQQAYWAAMSGLRYATALLQKPPADRVDLYDNPEDFRNQFVCDDGANKWYFTIYAPSAPACDKPRFGLIDEAAKINLNVASEQTIRSLLARWENGDELADALLDYRDSDSETRSQGAEQDYYDTLKIPYTIKNGRLTTLEELLMVKGFTGPIVYGEDANLNGLLDPNEDDGDATFPPDNSDGKLDTGLMETATTSSYERSNASSDKIDLNGDGSKLAQSPLPQQAVRFITAYLEDGNRFGHPSELLEMTYTLKSDSKKFPNLKKGAKVESGVGEKELPDLMSRFIASPAARRRTIPGLVNVNTASKEVLTILLNNAQLASAIANARADLTPADMATTAWLFTKGIVDAPTYKKIAPLLSTCTYQYRVRCVGFGVPCGRFRVLEAQIDLARATPRIIYLRDLTRLGLPFAMEIDKETVGTTAR